MDKNKQIELIRERNSNLTKQLEDLKKQLNDIENNNHSSTIKELDELREQWKDSIERLERYEKEYIELIKKVKSLLREIKYSEINTPFYKKVIFKIKNIIR